MVVGLCVTPCWKKTRLKEVGLIDSWGMQRKVPSTFLGCLMQNNYRHVPRMGESDKRGRILGNIGQGIRTRRKSQKGMDVALKRGIACLFPTISHWHGSEPPTSLLVAMRTMCATGLAGVVRFNVIKRLGFAFMRHARKHSLGLICVPWEGVLSLPTDMFRRFQAEERSSMGKHKTRIVGGSRVANNRGG